MSETFVTEKIASIKDYLSIHPEGIKISTCDAFHWGWNQDDFYNMPYVARKLEAEGFAVREQVNFGVNDYFIS